MRHFAHKISKNFPGAKPQNSHCGRRRPPSVPTPEHGLRLQFFTPVWSPLSNTFRSLWVRVEVKYHQVLLLHWFTAMPSSFSVFARIQTQTQTCACTRTDAAKHNICFLSTHDLERRNDRRRALYLR